MEEESKFQVEKGGQELPAYKKVPSQAKVMKKETIVLSNEKFKDIYTNEKLRNAVAFAHGSCDSNGNLLHYIALDHPNRYIVTTEQVQIAKSELARKKMEKIRNMQVGTLVFVAMSSDYAERYEGDLCNHRIRTEFFNSDGRHFFVEFIRGNSNSMYCTFSIDRDLQEKYRVKMSHICSELRNEHRGTVRYADLSKELSNCNIQPYYNYGNLQKRTDLGIYSKNNLLKIINDVFGCNYTSIEVDRYTLRTDDFVCKCA